MSATRDPDRLLRAWLDLMPDEAPDRAIAAVLQATQGTPQARVLPWAGIGRTPRMNRIILVAATALVIVGLLGGAIYMAGDRSGPVPATPTPTPAPTPEPSREPAGAAAESLWGDWIADVDGIPEIAMPAGMIQLSVDWQAGERIWLQTTPDYRQLLSSTPIESPQGELRLRSNATENQCPSGSEGRYSWNRSSDGLFLTLTLIEDACADRSAAFARTWVRSLGAVHTGGPGVVYATKPMTKVTLPAGQRMGASSGKDWQEIKTFGDLQPFQAFVVVTNPGGFGAPCSTGDTQKQSIPPTMADLISYVQGLPGASARTTSVEVGGRPAIQFDYTIDGSVECESGEIAAFHPQDPSDTFTWNSVPGELQRIYIVQVDASTTFLLWYQGNSETERQVIGSISFIDALPTP